MKIVPWIVPAIALVLVGTWGTYQHQSISSLEAASAVLKTHITSARATDPDSGSLRTRPVAPTSKTEDMSPLDWKKIAGQLVEMQQSGDMRAMEVVGKRTESMSKEQLVAALGAISALDLPTESRERLEWWLIGSLVEKDPELGLTCCADRVQNDKSGMISLLCHHLGKWAENDPASATAWFDKQVDAGKFDSKSLDGVSRNRNEAEGILLRVLFCNDPAAAARRLSAMPESERTVALDASSLQSLGEKDQIAFAALVRSQAPEKDQAKLLAHQTYGDYAETARYMDRIAATPAERIVCIQETANSQIRRISGRTKITREDLETLREWTTAQAPASTDSVTGKALADMIANGSKQAFAAASEWVLLYNPTSGNDDVLTSFLSGIHPKDYKDEARALAEKITDPKFREEFLTKFQ